MGGLSLPGIVKLGLDATPSSGVAMWPVSNGPDWNGLESNGPESTGWVSAGGCGGCADADVAADTTTNAHVAVFICDSPTNAHSPTIHLEPSAYYYWPVVQKFVMHCDPHLLHSPKRASRAATPIHCEDIPMAVRLCSFASHPILAAVRTAIKFIAWHRWHFR